MRFTLGQLQIRVRCSFIAYLIFLGMADGASLVFSMFLSLLIHEAAHLYTANLLHESFSSIEFTPFGGILSYQTGKSSLKGLRGLMIAASGPLANCLMIQTVSMLPPSQGFLLNIQKKLLVVNASMFLLNALPVLPLDGGRIVFSIAFYLFPISASLAFLTLLSGVTGAVFIMLSLYGLSSLGKLNISLLLVGIYIIAAAKGEREMLLINNYYSVLHELCNTQADEDLNVKLYYVNMNVSLLHLLPALCKKNYCIYLVDCCDRKEILYKEDVIEAIALLPHGTIGDMLSQQKQTNTETI